MVKFRKYVVVRIGFGKNTRFALCTKKKRFFGLFNSRKSYFVYDPHNRLVSAKTKAQIHAIICKIQETGFAKSGYTTGEAFNEKQDK